VLVPQTTLVAGENGLGFKNTEKIPLSQVAAKGTVSIG